MNPKQVKATARDVAQATGLKLSRVRRDQRNGVFDLHDVVSLSNYVSGHRLLKEGMDV